jgi:hypothetical protein
MAVASPVDVHPGVATGLPSVDPGAASAFPLTIRLPVSTFDELAAGAELEQAKQVTTANEPIREVVLDDGTMRANPFPK